MCRHRWRESLLYVLADREWLCPSCLLASLPTGAEARELVLLSARARAWLCVSVGERRSVYMAGRERGLEEQIALCAALVESRLGFDPRKER